MSNKKPTSSGEEGNKDGDKEVKQKSNTSQAENIQKSNTSQVQDPKEFITPAATPKSNMDDMSRRRSILKGSEARKQTTKRLSFALAENEVLGESGVTGTTPDTPVNASRRSVTNIVPTNIQSLLQNLDMTPQVDQTTTSGPLDITSQTTASRQSTRLSVPGDSSLNKSLYCRSVVRTSLGNCYVPSETKKGKRVNKVRKVPVGQNTRNVFSSVFGRGSSLPFTAKVMIIGEENLGEKIKLHLEKVHKMERQTEKHVDPMELYITCCSDPDKELLPSVHLFIITVRMDRLNSPGILTRMWEVVRSGGVPCQRVVVLSVVPIEGQQCVVVDQEGYNNLLYHHGLMAFPWLEASRPNRLEGERLLGLIRRSVGLGTGTSLLMEHLAQLTFNNQFRDNNITL